MRRRSSRTKEVTREKQGVMPTSTLDRKAEEIASQWEEQYDPSQFAPLAMAILLKAQKKLKTDMTAGIRKSYIFKRKVLPAVHAARDWRGSGLEYRLGIPLALFTVLDTN